MKICTIATCSPLYPWVDRWVGHQVIFECWVTWTHHPKELPGNPQKMCFLYNQSAGTVKNASENLPCNFFERILPPIVFYRQKWETCPNFLQCRHIVSLFFAGFFRNPGSVNPRFASVKLPSHGGIESSQKSHPMGSSTSLQVAPVAGFFQHQLFPLHPLVTVTEGAIPPISPPCRVDPDSQEFLVPKTWPKGGNGAENLFETCVRISSQQKLGGGFKYFLFSSLFGEMIQFD